MPWLKSFVAASCLLVANTPQTPNAQSPWNGTWKLNEGKSRLTGGVQHWDVSGEGLWKVAIGSIAFSYRCDGKPYTVFQGKTLVCHQPGSDRIETVVSAGPDQLAHSFRTLSEGDTIMRVDETGKTGDGTAFQKTELFHKIPGSGPGWSGAWRSASVQNTAGDVETIQVRGDSITFTYPVSHSTLTARLDGTPAREQGPHPTGIDISLRAAGPRSLTEVESEKGKEIDRETLRLSADGRQMTVEVLESGGSDKQVLVYDRQ